MDTPGNGSDSTPERPGLLQRLAWRQQAAGLWLLWAVAALLPTASASATAYRLMRWLGPRTRKHRHVLANLRMVCADCDEARIRQLGEQCWGNTGAVLAEYAKLAQLAGEGGAALDIVCIEDDPPFLRRQRPCVFVGAHLGNWELIPPAAGRLGFAVDAVYNPQANPVLERMVQRRRSVLGCDYIGRDNAVRRMVSRIRKGRSIAMLVDYRIDGGELIPFFAAAAATSTAPAWLSAKLGCDIVPVQVERLDGVRFRITFHPALTAAGSDEPAAQAITRVTTELNRVLETFVSANPGQWLCTKRRWPKAAMKQQGAYRD